MKYTIVLCVFQSTIKLFRNPARKFEPRLNIKAKCGFFFFLALTVHVGVHAFTWVEATASMSFGRVLPLIFPVPWSGMGMGRKERSKVLRRVWTAPPPQHYTVTPRVASQLYFNTAHNYFQLGIILHQSWQSSLRLNNHPVLLIRL